VLEEVVGDRVPNSQADEEPRFYVAVEGRGGISTRSSDSDSDNEGEPVLELLEEQAQSEREWFRGLLQLLQIGPALTRCRRGDEELVVDFSKCVLLTSDAYITMMREKIQLKEAVAKEREERRQQAARKKVETEASRSQHEAEKLHKAINAFATKAFKAKWSPEALRDAGLGL
jgi:hypothetical protein